MKYASELTRAGSRIATEGDHVAFATGIAVEVREAPSENSAVEVLVQFFCDELRQRPTAGRFGPFASARSSRVLLAPDDGPVAKGNLCAQSHSFNLHAATKVAANDKHGRLTLCTCPTR